MLLPTEDSEVLAAIDDLNCGILARDRSGIVLHVNARLLAWTGFRRDEIEGHPVDTLVPKELRDIINEEMKSIDDGDLRVRLGLLRRKDGTTFPVLLIPARLHDIDGAVWGGISVLVDLGAVQTAKSFDLSSGDTLRGSLSKIALDIQTLAITAESAPSAAALLEHPDIADLSPREREVLGQLMTGERVPAIAKELHISPHTVRNHLKSIFRKLDVGNQSELIQKLRRIND